MNLKNVLVFVALAVAVWWAVQKFGLLNTPIMSGK